MAWRERSLITCTYVSMVCTVATYRTHVYPAQTDVRPTQQSSNFVSETSKSDRRNSQRGKSIIKTSAENPSLSQRFRTSDAGFNGSTD